MGFGHLGVSHTQTQPPILLKKGAMKTAVLVGGNEESEGGRGREERERARRGGGGIETCAHTDTRTHARARTHGYRDTRTLLGRVVAPFTPLLAMQSSQCSVEKAASQH